MSEAQELLLVLGVLYLLDCLLWVPRSGVVLRSWLGRRYRIASPSRLAGNELGGLVLAPPLPPLGTVFECPDWPVAVSPDGVCARGIRLVRSETPAEIAFTQITSVTASAHELMVNGAPLVKASSERLAAELAAVLNELRAMPKERRASAIERSLAQRLDTQAAAARVGLLAAPAFPLKVACNLLFGYVFVLAPLAAWWFGLWSCWPALLLGLIACVALVVRAYLRAQRRLRSGERSSRTKLLVLALSPLDAIRAHDVLTRDWLAGCHPLAAAAALLGPERFRDHATAAFADLRALSHDAAQRGPGVASWFEQAHARAWQAFAERHQLDWHGSRAAPPRESPRVLAYCPRCAAQYERIGGNCADCEGVALQPFPAA